MTITKTPAPRAAAHRAAPMPAPVRLPIPAAGNPKFLTEKGSPFPDGYSIRLEEAALADFLADPDRMSNELDPLWDRYAELTDRKDRLELDQARYNTRKGSESVVEAKEFFGFAELGPLVDDEDDQMELHTMEAYRMFMGRARAPGSEVQPITGGKRIASALRHLWSLTSSDNPYADWALLRYEDEMGDLVRRLDREVRAAEALIRKQEEHGLKLSVLRSAAPKMLSLGFKSPYGYAVATLLSSFDLYVRLQKTLARKHLQSDEQVRASITALTRSIRRVFNETARFDRWLAREEVRELGRVDFTPAATDEGRKRVEFATGVFGPVPSQIYGCQLQPRHSRRRLQISPAERQLLAEVAAGLEQAEQDASTTGATPVPPETGAAATSTPSEAGAKPH